MIALVFSFTQDNLGRAEGENEDAGLGHLVEQVLDFCRGHLAVVVMIEIAMHAALIAAIGQVELNAERNVRLQRLSGHFLQESAHRASPAAGFRWGMGSSEIWMMSWLASSRARV